MNLEKNKTYTAECSSLGSEGEGIVKIDGFTLFVEGMLPGEKAEILIVKLKKNYGYGKVMKLLEVSDKRCEPACPYIKTCGGCSLQHMSYKSQLEFKRQKVKDCLERIGGLKEIDHMDTVGMDEPWNYRNKAQYPVGLGKDGKAIIGFYSPRSHRITDINSCMLQMKNADKVIKIFKDFINDFKIPVYDETAHRGLIRHILTRTGYSTGEIMVTIVANENKIPHTDELIKRLQNIDGLASIVLNINKDKTNVILGGKCITLWGKNTIRDKIGGISFDISALSFYQVNPVQTEKLYSLAVEAAGLTGNENVIDVYCGIGTISLFAAKKAKHVHGIEIVPKAIEDAKHNAEINGITNADFEAGKAEDILPKMFANGTRADVIFLDPPRKGLEPSVIDAVCGMEPDRIVYVSCGPATLARDMKLFAEKGYTTNKVQTVDMFPQTGHVESVVLMTKK
ncbi:MAG: 23S rRNA (uracil(1939)-C(5))-methyltransferase RlmD [Clostridiales bacterium]|nr:23S rRNA (uracil(1939)-C(5))-methyltransferase RlmD [Clostridiales bacterium]